MADSLDEIDWSQIKHAYGSAEDLPGTLRKLRSEDPEERGEAYDELYGRIHHQGTRYEASAAAIPYLGELASDPTTPERYRVLRLFVALALGSEEGHAVTGFDAGVFRDAVSQALEEADEGWREEWAEYGVGPAVDLACYDAGLAQVPRLRTLTHDSEPLTRELAAHALAWFPSEAQESLALFERHLSGGELSASEMTNLLIAYGLLAQTAPGLPRDEFLRPYLQSPSPEVRFGAAVSLSPRELSDEGIAALGAIASNPPSAQQLDLEWNSGDLQQLALRAFRAQGHTRREEVIPLILKVLPDIEVHESPVILETLLYVTRPGGFADVPSASLTELEREALKAVALHPASRSAGKHGWVPYVAVLEGAGLPPKTEEFCDYLGIDPLPLQAASPFEAMLGAIRGAGHDPAELLGGVFEALAGAAGALSDCSPGEDGASSPPATRPPPEEPSEDDPPHRAEE